MKNVTDNFKNDIRTYGRQFDFKFNVNNVEVNTDSINSIKPSFNSSLFKTIMNKVEIDSQNDIEKKSPIDIQVGIKVNEDNYEYINYNTYYVEDSERQEDTLSYIITAYDKMIEAMIDYDLEIWEKITLREYLIKICQRLGWNTKNIPESFINSEKLVDPTLHQGIKYTFRDVLDEIATISCSFLLFKGKELYLLYPTETKQNIDESYLNEDDITIREKYFINSLVFSRAEESDNIYRKDNDNIQTNGLHEYRISDNQLLSTNDRDLYIDEMFNYLKTFEFYIYDVKSKGILFLEACDRFNFKLSGNTYTTLLLNNEIEFNGGLAESLYVDKPKETETEYKYADKTDKKINQTTLMVDKQNQKIQGLVEQIGDRTEKTTTITAEIDEISSKVSTIADLTNDANGIKSVSLEKCVNGEIVEIHIYGNNVVFKYQYLDNNLYLSDNLALGKDKSIIIITDENGNKTYNDLGIEEVLRQNGSVYDEYILKDGQAQIIRRINKDGTIKDNEETEDLGEFHIPVPKGNNTLEIKDFSANIYVKWAVQNEYTDIFATRAEMNSNINQTSQEIKLSVDKKLENYSTTTEMNSSISQTAESINSEVRKKVGEDEIISKINQSAEEVSVDAQKLNINGVISANGNFQVDTDGNMICNNGQFNGGQIKLISPKDAPKMSITTPNYYNTDLNMSLLGLGIIISKGNDMETGEELMRMGIADFDGELMGTVDFTRYSSTASEAPTSINAKEIYSPDVSCFRLTQYSKEDMKKNFEKLTIEEALSIIKNTEIYKYNLKAENNGKKKHIGFIIGKNYKHSKDITAEDKNGEEIGADIYAMVSASYKVIQEQQEQIETLQKKLKEMEAKINEKN